jgi:flavorubredoxin
VNDAVTEILPGRLFAIGGWLPLGQHRISWLPDGMHGVLPVNAYVLKDSGQFLLIDTGLPIHREEIAAGLAETLAFSPPRRVIMTRREPDCMLNLPWIMHDFAVDQVLYAGPLNPLDFFQDVEDAEIAGRLTASGAGRAAKITDGSITEIGTLRLEVLRTELRLLATNWFYEQVTQTLFSSDSFGFLAATAPSSRIGTRIDIEPPEIARFLAAKMDWLIGVDPAPIIADLDRLRASRPIARICPGFGCVIEGTQAVTHAFDGLTTALRLLGARQRVSALGNFLRLVAS